MDLSEAPRFIFIRKSLECAQLQGEELRPLATSPDQAENQQAIAILDTEAAGAPAKDQFPRAGITRMRAIG